MERREDSGTATVSMFPETTSRQTIGHKGGYQTHLRPYPHTFPLRILQVDVSDGPIPSSPSSIYVVKWSFVPEKTENRIPRTTDQSEWIILSGRLSPKQMEGNFFFVNYLIFYYYILFVITLSFWKLKRVGLLTKEETGRVWNYKRDNKVLLI